MNSVGKSIVFVLAGLSCTGFGFIWRDIQNRNVPDTTSVNRLFGIKGTTNISGETVFKQNYERILTDYAKPIKEKDLYYAAISGMVSSLGDPHTMFLPPRIAKAFTDETTANFSGIGARLGTDSLGAKVAVVFDDGPAKAGGLKAGNIIVAVDGKSVAGKDINDIVEKIKGKEGTVVKLTVMQSENTKPVVLSIRRAHIVAPTVESKVLPGNVGYIQISSFSEPTTAQFDHEISKVESQGIRSLVIDLRQNPGGLLETAADMLGRFVEDKVVVTMKFRTGESEVVRTPVGELHKFSYPIAVLIDQDSASAAEIFTGVLKDYGKVTVVGTHSYGKASVQQVYPLVDQSSAKITIAKYYLPGGEFIGRSVDDDGMFVKGGLTPDVNVELTSEVLVTIGEPKTDNQLSKAIEVLKSRQ